MNKREAAESIAGGAKREIEEKDRDRFVEVVETELSCLHEGNIARYRLRPGQFRKWKENWE